MVEDHLFSEEIDFPRSCLVPVSFGQVKIKGLKWPIARAAISPRVPKYLSISHKKATPLGGMRQNPSEPRCIFKIRVT